MTPEVKRNRPANSEEVLRTGVQIQVVTPAELAGSGWWFPILVGDISGMHPCRVVPQFVNAKLVQISAITMVKLVIQLTSRGAPPSWNSQLLEATIESSALKKPLAIGNLICIVNRECISYLSCLRNLD